MWVDREVRSDEEVASQERSSFIRKYATWSCRIAVILIALALWWPRLSGPIDLRWDGGVYYLLGTSLASGRGYRILSEPGAPEAIQYPPLLPAFIALHQRVLGTTDPAVVAPWLRRSYAVIFFVFALSTLALARRFLPDHLALIATALCLCQIMTVFMSDLLFTELPFALLSVLFVLVATSKRLGARPWLRETMAFLLAAASFLLRTAGLALLAAWVFEALVRRRWRSALLRGALSLLPLLLWQTYVVRVRASQEYAHPAYEYQRASYQYYNVSYTENIGLIDPFRPELGRISPVSLARRVATNIVPMIKAVGETISTKQDFWSQISNRLQRRVLAKRFLLPQAVLFPIFAYSVIAIIGLYILDRRRAWLMLALILFSLALGATTPWPAQFSRYLMPVTPFLAICAMLTIRQVVSWLAGKPARMLVTGKIVLGCALLATFLLQGYGLIKAFRLRRNELPTFASGQPNAAGARLFYHDPTWLAWEKAATWIGANASPDAIVATSAPHFLYLLTGRHAVLPPMEVDATRAASLLQTVPVSYVIVDKLDFLDVTRRYARQAVESDPAKWRPVHSFDGTTVYERTGARE